MTNTFYKYQGTGNDFIVLDNRSNTFNKRDVSHIAFLCDRRFGIGADGLILLEDHEQVDFKMIYFNADGKESSMCGNGGRCIVAFAKLLNIIKDHATFEAIDGMHKASIEDQMVRLHMSNVNEVIAYKDHVFLDTGSPHHVQLQSNIASVDVKSEGAKIRYGVPYYDTGSNVNFVEKISETTFAVRTYERGVEDETLSCGTGVTAVAIAMHYIGELKTNSVNLKTPGGDLQVSFRRVDASYEDIWLIGPATLVFKGELS